MTRNKMKLEFIANASSRKTTFQKRKNNVIKKINELSTLCGITACTIIYSPYNSAPEAWPSNAGVQRVIEEFRALPKMDQHKRMVDQETFLQQKIAKEVDHLKRQRKDNGEQEMTELMFHCLKGEMGKFHLNITDFNDLGDVIDQYLKDVNHRLEILANSGMEIDESSNVVQAEVGAAVEGVGIAATTTPITMDFDADSSSFAAAVTFFNFIQQHQYHAQFQAHAHDQAHIHAHTQTQAQPQDHAQVQTQTQPFHYSPTPHVGYNEQLQNFNMSDNQNQIQQQWFMKMMNHHEMSQQQIGFTMDENHHNRNHHELHHQQIAGESINALTVVSSNIIPATTSINHHNQQHPNIPNGSSPSPASVNDLNLTNNTLFR